MDRKHNHSQYVEPIYNWELEHNLQGQTAFLPIEANMLRLGMSCNIYEILSITDFRLIWSVFGIE